MTTTPNTPEKPTRPTTAQSQYEPALDATPRHGPLFALRVTKGALCLAAGADLHITAPTELRLAEALEAEWIVCQVRSGHSLPVPGGIELEPGRWSWQVGFDKIGPVLLLRNVETGVEIAARAVPKNEQPVQ